jgi:hypothetical protein
MPLVGTSGSSQLLTAFRIHKNLNAVFWDMAPCGTFRNDDSDKLVAISFRAEIISEIGTMLLLLLLLLLLFTSNCEWVFTRWQLHYKTIQNKT